jgi:WxL interacting protein linking bacterial and host surfaces
VTRLLVGLCAVVAGLAVVPAALAGEASFALRPVTFDPNVPATQSYYIFDSKPGATIRTELRVTNVGTVSGTALLYAVDATTGRTSGAVYRSGSAKRRDVGRWVVLSASRITLGPQESRVVPFSVLVPQGSGAGEHVGGIVAQNLALQTGTAKQVAKGRGSLQIRLRHLTIVAVEVKLPGRRIERVVVQGVKAGAEAGYPAVEVGLRNGGNVIVKPRLRLRIIDRHGKTLLDQRRVLDSLVPQTAIGYPLILSRALRPGDYRADLRLDYGQGIVTRVTRRLRVKDTRTLTYTSAAGSPVASQDGGNGRFDGLPWLVAAAGLVTGITGIALALRARRGGAARSPQA